MIRIYKFIIPIVITFMSLHATATQLIIKLKPSITQEKQLNNTLGAQNVRNQLMQSLSSTLLYKFSQASGMKLHDIKPIAIGGRVIATEQDLDSKSTQEVINKLKLLPEIEYVEEDVKGYLASTTTGQLNPLQWDIAKTSIFDGLTYYGSNFTGSEGTIHTWVPIDYGKGVTVAVVDTGYIPHPDFVNNLVPIKPGSHQYGYQFITTCGEAGTCNPGESEGTPIPFQADALDRGMSDQRYHGSHIIGTIVGNGYGNSNPTQGVVGGAPGAKIVPVLVSGKTTQYTSLNVFLSDVINGMLWAGGEPVLGTEKNVNPAKVINLSVGFMFTCPKSLEQSIDVLYNKDINMVFAAMNSMVDAKKFAPANCPNSNHVIIVAAVGPTQKLAPYSDYGNVTISAAGGDGSSQYGQIYSTTCNDESINIGCNTLEGNHFGWKYLSGTSMAAPHVVAAVAVLLGKYPKLKPAQIIEALQKSATPFNPGNNCSDKGCVTNGILNVEAAIKYVKNQN